MASTPRSEYSHTSEYSNSSYPFDDDLIIDDQLTQDVDVSDVASSETAKHCPIKGMQKALIVKNTGPNYYFALESVPIPELGPLDVLVRLEVTGFCGTDYGLCTGHFGATCSILGHEGIGRVVALGSAFSPSPSSSPSPPSSPRSTSTSTQPHIGQRVGVGWLRDACGNCHPCMQPAGETRCELRAFSGLRVPGTLAQYTVVPSRYLVPLAEDLPAPVLAPVMCAGVTAYAALKQCGAAAGSWVAVVGAAGSVGMLAVQYARAMGYRVLAVDAGTQRAGLCREAGAEGYLDCVEAGELAGRVRELTRGAMCAAALVCAGVAAAYESAIPCLDYFGTLVCVGIPPPDKTVRFAPVDLIDTGKRFIGSLVGSRAEIAEAVEFVRRRLVTPKMTLIGMEELNEHVQNFGQLETKLVVDLS